MISYTHLGIGTGILINVIGLAANSTRLIESGANILALSAAYHFQRTRNHRNGT
jgi:hypothetical protein